jgi:hypothetical protein
MRTLGEAAYDDREQAVSIETDARTPQEVYDAINEEMGEEFLPLDEIAAAIEDGWIEICADGIVVWQNG